MTNTKTVALSNIILKGTIGSTAYGLAIENVSDYDEMGIFVEPRENVCGLHRLDHYIHRDKPDGVRSELGDLDLSLYSLRRFCDLMTSGNPSVIMLLWLPDYLIKEGPIAHKLIEMRQDFICRKAGDAFVGYLVSQRKRMTGELSRNINRPELVEKFGYDTKFASHALRLGLQGIEYLTDGTLTLPIKEPDRSAIMSIKTGKIPFDEALAMVLEAEEKLKAIVDKCNIQINFDKIDKFLSSAHEYYWELTRFVR